MLTILLFELRFRLRQIANYIFFALLFAVAVAMIRSDIAESLGGRGQVAHNAPFLIAEFGAFIIIFGTLFLTAIAGTGVYRDFEANVHELFFTARISKLDYYLGRFIGSYLTGCLVFSAIPLGFLAGSLYPASEGMRLDPFRADAYLFLIGVYLLPNLFFISALFFVVGAVTRSLLAIYTQGIVLLAGWTLTMSLLSKWENERLSLLFDAFGIGAAIKATQEWTIYQKSRELIPLTGDLLWNRLLWVGVGVAALVVGYYLFTFGKEPLALFLMRGRRATTAKRPLLSPLINAPIPTPRGWAHTLSVFTQLIGFYYREIVRGAPFLIITLIGISLTVITASQADEVYGVSIYPVTRIMAHQVGETFALFFILLATFYAGELVWRERVLRLDQVSDALPIPTAAVLLAKVASVLLMLATLCFILIASGVGLQIYRGYYHFELPLYFSYIFGYLFTNIIPIVFLSFFLHTLINQKFLAHTALVFVYVASAFLPYFGWDRHLYRFDSTPDVTLSDMNGFGPYLTPVFWFTLYWIAVATALLALASRLWVRGKDDRLRERVRHGRASLGEAAVGISAALVAVGVGAFTLYNTDYLNEYVSSREQEKRQAQYERDYKKWEKRPMPRIVGVVLDADLRPEKDQFVIAGTYRLKNKTDKPITEIAVDTDQTLTLRRLVFGVPATPAIADKKTGFYTFRLAHPLSPGAETTLEFTLARDRGGFTNNDPNASITANGTFLTMPVPRIGYQSESEISDADKRNKQHLPPRPRMASVTDTAARMHTYIGNDADWIDFEATVRTAPDQIALAPGYLQKEWTENGRRCFRYKMDAPIRNFYSFLSARYAVKKEVWVGKDGKKVALEIYYHPAHKYNLERMLAGMKAALSYCSENYAPYQFRQLRIVEFPDYAKFAQSFPNTVPFSEGIGFIARVNDRQNDIDYPFLVTAHETAHQWWAHQVLGGDVEGATMLSESLAEYTALQVMKRHYGAGQMRHFLRYEREGYFKGRGSESVGENPLVKVQNQPYIHYQKGAMAFYAVANRIGEKQLNAALARFIHDKGFQEPPYTTSLELLSYLREATPKDEQDFLTDLFEKITLYDLSTKTATQKPFKKDKATLTLTVHASKIYADSAGKETKAPLDDTFDIGAFLTTDSDSDDDLGKPLLLTPVRLKKSPTTLIFPLPEAADTAGIDPYNTVIERHANDNVIDASFDEEEPPKPATPKLSPSLPRKPKK